MFAVKTALPIIRSTAVTMSETRMENVANIGFSSEKDRRIADRYLEKWRTYVVSFMRQLILFIISSPVEQRVTLSLLIQIPLYSLTDTVFFLPKHFDGNRQTKNLVRLPIGANGEGKIHC